MRGESIGVIETRRNAKLKKLAGIGPVLQGTISAIGVKCGNPNCRCVNGEKHSSNILTRKIDGKTKSVYVPAGMLEEAKKWTREYARAKALLQEISDCDERILKLYVKTKKAAKANQAAAKRRSP
jgi:hypothetical protein